MNACQIGFADYCYCITPLWPAIFIELSWLLPFFDCVIRLSNFVLIHECIAAIAIAVKMQ